MSVRVCVVSLLSVLVLVLFGFLIVGGGTARVDGVRVSGAMGSVGCAGGDDLANGIGGFAKDATFVLPGVGSQAQPAGPNASAPSVASGAPVIDVGARRAGVSEDWLGKVKAQIEREEYKASVNERGLQAPNRAHNLRTYFVDGGIEVVPRKGEDGDSWSFSWRTLAWGREGRLVDVTGVSVEPVADGSRVTYSREGLDEWYENKKEGLEQGFRVMERPEAEGLLCIEGSVGSGLRAEFRAEDGAIDFMDGYSVRVLRYAELHVRDAGGREVPSHLKLEGDRVAIVIDDAGAVVWIWLESSMFFV
ncbi:MAG: hypothetical protein NTX17_01490 [Candidatus Eisenbacteria bacterium]|nr:hypothetical protein [Candidatus Eisenbacteria bacterium]